MDITTAVRRGLPAVVLVAAGLALTACGPDNTTGASSPSSGTGAAASASDTPGSGSTTGGGDSGDGGGSGSGSGGSTGGSASATPGTGSGSGGAKTAPAGGGSTTGVATCTGEHLKVSTSEPLAGAGSLTFQIIFTNTGSKPCTLSGYPGVSFDNASGKQLGNAATRTSAKTGVVTLIPNAHAVAEAKTADGPGGFSASACDLTKATTLRVYPPNRKEWLRAPWERKVCAGTSVHALQVGPVHPIS